MENKTLLSGIKTFQKIKRIAYEIYEANFTEKEIILVGIKGEGHALAIELKKYLEEISPVKISIGLLEIDKSLNYQSDINISSDVDTFKNKTVILVDDVLNTGRTLAFSLRPFLSIPLKKLQVAVLVNRGNTIYPIAADFSAYQLSTTLTEHVEVVISDNKRQGVYLY